MYQCARGRIQTPRHGKQHRRKTQTHFPSAKFAEGKCVCVPTYRSECVLLSRQSRKIKSSISSVSFCRASHRSESSCFSVCFDFVPCRNILIFVPPRIFYKQACYTKTVIYSICGKQKKISLICKFFKKTLAFPRNL